MPTLDEAVTTVLTPVFAAGSEIGADLALEEVSVTTAGRRQVVRVVVDRAGDEPGDLDLDAVAAASTAVSEALDESGVLGEAPYTLEVSSPGVDRPLTTPRHWSRARGRLVRAVLTDGTALLVRVVSVDEAGVHGTLEPQMVKGKPPRAKDVGAPRDLAWADLVRGEVQVEFRRPGEDVEDLVADPGVDDELDELDDVDDGDEDEQ
ncbi:ribosome maturation factor RimP [Kineococcus radiotolerans]|uniref:Ribosome maturation factor RimP n=1 Tax=Kineococcus radiotolerans TaxID=131568 RepID=A0A7W4TJ35_KINRA|nr:ribosome maturation factor RimP [Kineococcus radiotolerans]MBB2899871.1 ribosome maturation factor RimP [Kineococcus radiotolerans]